MDIILNLKKVKFRAPDHEARTASISVLKEGAVTAGDIHCVQGLDVVNPSSTFAPSIRNKSLKPSWKSKWGAVPPAATKTSMLINRSESSRWTRNFSVTRVKYAVENTRVGQRTDYDKLILDVWTDGTSRPGRCAAPGLRHLRHHLDVFVGYDDKKVEFDETPEEVSQENTRLKKLLNMSVNEIELSVGPANCLNNANITTVGQLAMKTEAKMLKYRNSARKH